MKKRSAKIAALLAEAESIMDNIYTFQSKSDVDALRLICEKIDKAIDEVEEK